MNKFKVWVLVGVLMLSFVSVSSATRKIDGLSFNMGTKISYFSYKEPDFMEEKGAMFGVYFESVYRQEENFGDDTLSNLLEMMMFAFESDLAFGQLDYTSNSTGELNDIDEMLYEVRGLVGIDIPLMDTTRLTPYIGFGFRSLDDNSGGLVSTTGHYGYDRESYYYYLPIGIKTMTDINEQWQVGANVEGDILLSGTQYSHLEQVDPAYSRLKNDQEDGWGIRGSVQILRTVEDWILSVEPYVKYWDIDQSNTSVVTCGGTPCAAGYEPKNESFEAGLRIGTQF